MLGRHRYSWSANEVFAQKKNAGEDAKLKDTVARLEKKFGLVKDSIRQEAVQVRTSLKHLRKSTGHSIEALPPTPFQMDLRRDLTSLAMDTDLYFGTIQSSSEFGEDMNENSVNAGYLSDRGYNFLNTSPYLKDVAGDLSSRQSCRSISDQSFMPKVQAKVNLINAQQGQDCDIPASTVLSNRENDAKEDGPNTAHISAYQKIHTELPSQADIIKTQEGGYRPDKNTFPSPLMEERSQTKHENQTESLKILNNHSFDSDLDLVDLPRHQRRESPSIPGNKRLTQRENKTLPSNKAPELRNIRTRCRTCLERFRQNRQYERQRKLEHAGRDKQETTDLIISEVKGGGDSNSLFIRYGDLESLFAESDVLDFDNPPNKTNADISDRGSHNKTRKGYSKSRLNLLAEPKAGRRKKILFSKHAIKKEVDSLTQRHSQPQLTEREKERLQIVESKIRMFLAVTLASGDVTPSSMVHIPAREDVMKVDISHL